MTCVLIPSPIHTGRFRRTDRDLRPVLSEAQAEKRPGGRDQSQLLYGCKGHRQLHRWLLGRFTCSEELAGKRSAKRERISIVVSLVSGSCELTSWGQLKGF